MTITPFKVDVPQKRLDHVLNRIRDADWPDVPEATDPWHYGASQLAVKDLVSYLLTKYDWRAREAEMNKFPHFKARVDDYDIHFIHVKGSGKNPQPIIVTPCLPGSLPA